MKGLLVKEYRALKSVMWIMLIFGIIVAACSFGYTGLREFLLSMFCLISAMLPLSVLNSDIQYGWSCYAEVLPVSKSEIVSSKYVLGLFGLVPSFFMIAVSTVIRYFAAEQPFVVGEIYFSVMALASSLALAAFVLLIVFRFGKNASLISMFLIGMFSGFSSFWLTSPDDGATIYPELSAMLTVIAVSAVVYAVCWFLSIRVYKKYGAK